MIVCCQCCLHLHANEMPWMAAASSTMPNLAHFFSLGVVMALKICQGLLNNGISNGPECESGVECVLVLSHTLSAPCLKQNHNFLFCKFVYFIYLFA